MLPLSEYTFLERIHFGNNNQLFRAERWADQKKVILNLLEHASSNRNERAYITSEYETAKPISSTGVARIIELKTYQDQMVVI